MNAKKLIGMEVHIYSVKTKSQAVVTTEKGQI